jgi:hypothetical protein
MKELLYNFQENRLRKKWAWPNLRICWICKNNLWYILTCKKKINYQLRFPKIMLIFQFRNQLLWWALIKIWIIKFRWVPRAHFRIKFQVLDSCQCWICQSLDRWITWDKYFHTQVCHHNTSRTWTRQNTRTILKVQPSLPALRRMWVLKLRNLWLIQNQWLSPKQQKMRPEKETICTSKFKHHFQRKLVYKTRNLSIFQAPVQRESFKKQRGFL